MCWMCDENFGDMESCSDCGRAICFDEQPDPVDVIDRAYVTASGDLYCSRCGKKYDLEEEREREAEYEGDGDVYYPGEDDDR